MNTAKERPSGRKKHEPVEGRLLATAVRCFTEEGFGFGIDDILAQADCAKMSLYQKFGSKYGLIERLLDDAARWWRAQIDRVVADDSIHGVDKVLYLLKVICTASRTAENPSGLLGQALVEFPLTKKDDDPHKKKDLVHQKARRLQRDLLMSLEGLCHDLGAADPCLLAQQIMLLVNGCLIMEPLLGKARAVSLALQTAGTLLGLSSVETKTPISKLHPHSTPSSAKSGEGAAVLVEKPDPRPFPPIKRTKPSILEGDEDAIPAQKLRVNRRRKIE